MKVTLPEFLLKAYIQEAQAGYGREKDAGGGNTSSDFTVFKSDSEQLAGGTVRIYLNKLGFYVGHKVLAPKKRP